MLSSKRDCHVVICWPSRTLEMFMINKMDNPCPPTWRAKKNLLSKFCRSPSLLPLERGARSLLRVATRYIRLSPPPFSGNGPMLRGSNGFPFSPNQGHIQFYHDTNSPQLLKSNSIFILIWYLISSFLRFINKALKKVDDANESFFISEIKIKQSLQRGTEHHSTTGLVSRSAVLAFCSGCLRTAHTAHR